MAKARPAKTSKGEPQPTTAAKFARNLLSSVGNLKVTVENVRQISVDQIVVSFVEKDQRYDDTYMVTDRKVMDTLLMKIAGKVVTATVAPGVEGQPVVLEAHAA